MRISDIIEDFIKELFEEEEQIEIQRNDLAQKFNCVPSQINYVISTRFKPSQGYYVESRRGGGGHILIKKVNTDKYEIPNEMRVGGLYNYLINHSFIEVFGQYYQNDAEKSKVKTMVITYKLKS